MESLYDNIKKRRIDLGMSQQTLAEKVGYTGKSMISKVEKGEVNLPVDMINKFACALSTSTTALYGDDEESAVLEAFRQSDQITKEMVKRILLISRKE